MEESEVRYLKISGDDYLSSQNSILRNQLQDFSTKTKASEIISAPVNADVSLENKNTSQNNTSVEDGVTLDISANGGAVSRTSGKIPNVTSSFAPTEFSTKSDENTISMEETPQTSNTESTNSVLNQYRFFVQSSQYEGSDGVVNRIFR